MRRGTIPTRSLVTSIALLAGAMVGLADAQTTARTVAGIPLKPGERLIAIDGVPVASNGQPARAVQTPAPQPATTVAPAAAQRPAGTNGTVQPASAQVATNIVGNLTPSNLPFSHTPGATALEKANAERRRYGKGPLLPDPQLQALALRKATIAAQRRYKNHIGGSLGSAQCEGVGHTNGRFLSCCLDEPGTHGGAAMVQGADGWYCCLLVR